MLSSSAMLRFIVRSIATTVVCSLFYTLGVPSAQAEQKQETWVDEKTEQLRQADQYANELLRKEKQMAKKPRRDKAFQWRVFGKFGYEYDDNVALASNWKTFRSSAEDIDAGRYSVGTGISADYRLGERDKVGVTFYRRQSFHDDGLDEYNFQDYLTRLRYQHMGSLADRLLSTQFSYNFDHGLLDRHSYASGHEWRMDNTWEWSERQLWSFYQALEAKNFRNKGYDKSVSSRDGFYEQTGLMYTFLFDQRRRSVSLAYEFSLAETEGNNYDAVYNGLRAMLRTPVIEKIRFETYFLFQDAYYRHFVTSPKRQDFRYQYEFRLSRPLGAHWSVGTFYRRTDVNNPNDGVLGQFNYDRNIGGVDLTFSYG
ncbi:MAG: hypothetical protein ACOY3K_02585 [Candidatus Omnitrophota bacterium]